MITFEKVTDVHYKVFSYGLCISSLAITDDSYIVINRYSSVKVPKVCKKHLKSILVELYNKDLKAIKLFTMAGTQNEGSLSIKKMINECKV